MKKGTKIRKTTKVAKEEKEFLEPIIPVQTPEEELEQAKQELKQEANKLELLLDNANWFEKIMLSFIGCLALILLAILFPFIWVGKKIKALFRK